MRFKAVLHREGVVATLDVSHAVARVPAEGGTCGAFGRGRRAARSAQRLTPGPQA